MHDFTIVPARGWMLEQGWLLLSRARTRMHACCNSYVPHASAGHDHSHSCCPSCPPQLPALTHRDLVLKEIGFGLAGLRASMWMEWKGGWPILCALVLAACPTGTPPRSIASAGAGGCSYSHPPWEAKESEDARWGHVHLVRPRPPTILMAPALHPRARQPLLK